MQDKAIITPKAIKTASFCFLGFIAIIIIYMLATNLPHIGKIAVEIKYAPFEASVFIDDQNYPVNNAVNYLEPGNHHIMVVMDGFWTIEEDVEVTEETSYLYGSLRAIDEDSEDPYREYQDQYLQVEGIAGTESTKEAEKLTDEWPILNYLPYIINNYSIGNYFDEEGKPVVTVRAEAAQLDQAINKLRSFSGVTLSDYNIVIVDFENVLEGKFINNNESNPRVFLEKGYQNLGTPYQVNAGSQSGDYHYTTISVGKYAGYISITYRVILHKVGDTWELAGTPYPLLTKYNTPGVDTSILDSVNSQDAPTSVQPDSSGDGH